MSKLKNPPVPFLDLSGQFKALQGEWMDALAESGARGSFILGPNVTEFEKEFAAYIGCEYAVALANGTDALTLSLRALDIGPGDEVITTPYTFFASAEAVTHVGATPVFVDIDADSFNLDVNQIEAKMNHRTRAIIPVHLFGHPADMTGLNEIAAHRDLKIIEDCAQACGAVHAGKKVGVFGDAGSFSFYPTKVLGCYGDGGLVTTHSEELAGRLLGLRNHGATGPFVHDRIGYNSRLDEVQASLLRIKLRDLQAAVDGRRRVAAHYARRFRDSAVIIPAQPADGGHVFNLYTVRVRGRDAVRRRLTDARIGCNVCYPMPLHLQPVYRHLGYRPGDLPNSERAAGECLSLPIFPEMRPEQVDLVCDILLSAV